MEFVVPLDDSDLLGGDFVKEDLDLDDVPELLKGSLLFGCCLCSVLCRAIEFLSVELSERWRRVANPADFLGSFDLFFACIR